jgi:hypothetical protein
VSYLREEFHTTIIPDTLRKVLLRDGRLEPVTRKPMEAERVYVSTEAVSDYIAALNELLGEIPSGFLWNVDELGHGDWPDAHSETVYVPEDFEADSVPIPVSRAGKRITLIGCICADGSFLKPLLIIPRHTVDADLKLFGISEANLKIVDQRHGFVDREIFQEWVVEMFLPEVRRRREETGSEGPAVLILDGCTAHDGDVFWDLCMENGIVHHFVPPHASNQVQPCDLCVFGITKRLITKLNRAPDGNIQSLQIAKLVSAFHSACNPLNVIASFRNAGIVSRMAGNGTPMASVDIEACRCLLDCAVTRGGPSLPAEIEDEEPDTAAVPLWLQLLDAEAAALLEESE